MRLNASCQPTTARLAYRGAEQGENSWPSLGTGSAPE